MTRYVVTDTETTTRNYEYGKLKASPFHPANEMVSYGYKIGGNSIEETAYSAIKTIRNTPTLTVTLPAFDILGGQNIKFDLEWYYKVDAAVVWSGAGSELNTRSLRDYLGTKHIWCTQSAEYILSSHRHLYPSLDELAVKYGGTVKDDRLKVCFQAGVPTEEIIPEMLDEYLREDVKNTEIVMLAQMEEAMACNKMPLIRTINSAILAYTEMETNGMMVDMPALRKYSNANKFDRVKYIKDLRGGLPHELTYLEDPFSPAGPKNKPIVNFNSPQQLSTMIYGGTFKYRVRELVGKYKNGKDKYKFVDKTYKNPLFRVSPKLAWKSGTPGIWKTSDEVLDEIAIEADIIGDHLLSTWIGTLRKLRTVEKEQSGYYDAIPRLLTPDGLLHQTINTTSTATGRLSQKEPNLQNVSGGKESNVKKVFISRWGDDGEIMEVDYSQLEVIGLAHLSGDPQLIEDIMLERDLHSIAHDKVRRYMKATMSEKEQRRAVKAVNFGLIYGGGAKTLSIQSGLPISVVKAIIKHFYDRYPQVQVWQRNVLEAVQINAESSTLKTEKGFPAHISTYYTETGRSYFFRQYDAPDWVVKMKKTDVSFSVTQIKNYPVQGLATGDIVPMVVAHLYRRLMQDPLLKDKCLLINTVHDSVVFDVHHSVNIEAALFAKEEMEKAPQLLKEIFGIDFKLPLTVSVSSGPNWKDQIED